MALFNLAVNNNRTSLAVARRSGSSSFLIDMAGDIPPVGGGVGDPPVGGVSPRGSRSRPLPQTQVGSPPPWSSDQLALVGLAPASYPSNQKPAMAGVQANLEESPANQSRASLEPTPRQRSFSRSNSWPSFQSPAAPRPPPAGLADASMARRPFMGTCAAAGTGSDTLTAGHVPLHANGSHATFSKQQTGSPTAGVDQLNPSLFGFQVAAIDFPSLPRRPTQEKADPTSLLGNSATQLALNSSAMHTRYFC